MKKVIFGMAVVVAAAFGVYNANKDNALVQMNDLQTENVEALAQTEVNTGVRVVKVKEKKSGWKIHCEGVGSLSCPAPSW
ncbi:MAG: hypothetical protein J6T70_14100 [Bacteroidales bacterium]|nr:hypothetical protein [Bacteroidales bacterium]